ncbi:hypothetical protein ES332_D02G041800v1 [Gossypium tomentosum]|uniref:Phorbol-ester/DAG-type domain-containing protein n=1 Tax=Gossypium tomentosum TaxID=34277 RepID=A0A5D2LT14_GOSTO|nr:hypothetical protein ES332_D02G041800v1 [Gossypium tomentosum]
MEIQHFSHHHPLVFIQAHSAASKAALCLGCEKPGCAELELAPKIQHPFHPEHPLTLLPKSPYSGGITACSFCGTNFEGFVYNCFDCEFDLHINFERDCSGCQKPLSGPIYHCLDCSYPTFFTLHKECVELPLEINHPCDRKHPLTLLPRRPAHPEKCICAKSNGAVDYIFSPPTITNASHEHPWMLISKKMSFICDFCGIVGDHSPYLCATCNLAVHKNCISLPRNIRITRHCHVICFSYSFQQNQVEDCMCRICFTEVDTSYGYDERLGPSNLITDVIEQISIEEIMVASKIKHSYHHHNLRLTFSGEIKDDSQCDGCMRPISTPFYSCEQCKFFLHKDCVELPKEMPHPFHKHLLTLSNSHDENGCSWCTTCRRLYQGFRYRCYKGDCYFEIDIQCMLLSDTLKHPSHEHSLVLVHNEGTSCSACFKNLLSMDVAYRCMKRCDFSLDVGCASLPLTAWYKYDRHALTLTFSDDSEPSQLYCDLCEKEREPNCWFYYCADCDNSLHLNCALGDLPYMKLGNKIKGTGHRHPLTVVKNIWNCPPCKVCGEVCNGQALECKESECNFTVHSVCCWFLYESSE